MLGALGAAPRQSRLLWRHALTGADGKNRGSRPSARDSLGHGPAKREREELQGSARGRGLSEEESCLAQLRKVNHDDIIQTGFP